MAIVQGTAGSYPKSRADQTFRRMLWFIISFTMIAGCGIGFFLARSSTVAGLIVGAIMIVVALCAERLMGPHVNAMAKERIQYLRGSQGEEFVGWLLQELENDWFVFHGIKLEQASDIDHIVVGPRGLYCISTKNVRGLFDLQKDGRVFYNNAPTHLIGNTMSQAMQVRDRMAALVGSDVPFVTPVLAVPQAFVSFGGPQKGVWVLTQEDLTKVIEGGGKRLSKEMISRCVNALKMLLNTRPELYRPATSSSPSMVDRAEAT